MKKVVAIKTDDGKDVAVDRENGQVKAAKWMAVDTENGQMKAAKGMVIDTKTDED
jgi:hypothetical protein